MPLTPEEVANKRFTTVRFKEGYDEAEVDRFLDEVEAELRRLLADNAGLRQQPAPPAEAPVPERMSAEEASEAALRTLMLAQRTADEAVAEAQAQAAQILSEAEAKAASLQEQAQRDHAATTASLAEERSGLMREVDALRDFERRYREQLSSHLKGHLAELDPATSLAPPSPPGLPEAAAPPLVDRPPQEPPPA